MNVGMQTNFESFNSNFNNITVVIFLSILSYNLAKSYCHIVSYNSVWKTAKNLQWQDHTYKFILKFLEEKTGLERCEKTKTFTNMILYLV